MAHDFIWLMGPMGLILPIAPLPFCPPCNAKCMVLPCNMQHFGGQYAAFWEAKPCILQMVDNECVAQNFTDSCVNT